VHSTSDDVVYNDYDFGDDDDETEGVSDDDDDGWTSDETEALSCIGVRRLCLRDASCRLVLRHFRQFCVENTRIHQCVTTQWFVVQLDAAASSNFEELQCS